MGFLRFRNCWDWNLGTKRSGRTNIQPYTTQHSAITVMTRYCDSGFHCVTCFLCLHGMFALIQRDGFSFFLVHYGRNERMLLYPLSFSSCQMWRFILFFVLILVVFSSSALEKEPSKLYLQAGPPEIGTTWQVEKWRRAPSRLMSVWICKDVSIYVMTSHRTQE